jgi:hypothetical protein
MRRIQQTLTLALGFLALVAVPVSAQDVAGTWVLAVDLGPAGGGDATFVFEQEGTAISGTYSGALGDGIDFEGTLEDGAFRLTFDSQAGEIIFSGTVEGTTMAGTCIYGQLGDGTFEGSKSG